MKKLLVSFIYLYRWLVSPFLPPSCKFTPTCSRYAISAIECHGVIKGLWMTLKRLMRCHPFSKPDSVYDPVPLAKTEIDLKTEIHLKPDAIAPFISLTSKQILPSDIIYPANAIHPRKLKRVHNA